MTKRKLIRIILAISSFYVVVFLTGLIFYFLDKTEGQRYYTEFKNFFPVIISIPLGYLGSCFQRRASFLTTLRTVWSNIIHAVNKAILYTEHRYDMDKEYVEVLLLLSRSIDEVRSVYQNIDETRTHIGLYPFESLKTIYAIIDKLKGDNISDTDMQKANAEIRAHWQTIRKVFLAEFDRTEPTFSDTIND
jgi:hypothetical protein